MDLDSTIRVGPGVLGRAGKVQGRVRRVNMPTGGLNPIAPPVKELNNNQGGIKMGQKCKRTLSFSELIQTTAEAASTTAGRAAPGAEMAGGAAGGAEGGGPDGGGAALRGVTGAISATAAGSVGGTPDGVGAAGGGLEGGGPVGGGPEGGGPEGGGPDGGVASWGDCGGGDIPPAGASSAASDERLHNVSGRPPKTACSPHRG